MQQKVTEKINVKECSATFKSESKTDGRHLSAFLSIYEIQGQNQVIVLYGPCSSRIKSSVISVLQQQKQTPNSKILFPVSFESKKDPLVGVLVGLVNRQACRILGETLISQTRR